MKSQTSIPAFFHAGFQGNIGLETADITPPTGVYSRCWGAALHDVAESVHRPLTVNVLTFSSETSDSRLVFVDADLGWWQSLNLFHEFQKRVLQEFHLEPAEFLFGITHTHSSPPLTKLDPDLPGSEIQKLWLEEVFETITTLIHKSLEQQSPAILDWNSGTCNLSTTRDLIDPAPESSRILCGYNPKIEADQTLLVGRITDFSSRKLRAVLVNYACHPTTLAWENKAISPDFIGAMREIISLNTGATALFFQGISGELSPRYQYVESTEVADRHGRQLGYAALATLENMEPPGTQLVFAGVMESGAPLAVWRHQPFPPSTALASQSITVEIPLKDWPTAAEFEKQRLNCSDRTLAERLRRKRDIRLVLGDEQVYKIPIWGWRVGDSFWIGTMAEAYSLMQQELRQQFPDFPIVCMNLVNGSIGYLPPQDLYQQDIYQVSQTPFDQGALELTISAAIQLVQQLKQATPCLMSSHENLSGD